jgi:DNA repair protein RadC
MTRRYTVPTTLLGAVREHGAPGRTDAELLALVAGMKPAAALFALTETGGLRAVWADPERFLTPNQAARVMAAREVATRVAGEGLARGAALTDPEATRRFLITRLRDLEHEVFAALFLDNRHRVIAFDVLFTGTLDGASVHPREVVKAALRHNAAALILAHNHPSGIADPSDADRLITRRLREALGLVDIRTLDHFVVGDGYAVSFAERGWI